MKILFISNVYPSKDLPQFGIYLEQPALALKENGCSVDVFCPLKECKNEKVCFNGINVSYYRLTPQNKIRGSLSTHLPKADYEYFDKVITNEYDCVAIHFANLQIINAVIKICKKKRIKVVKHFHGLAPWSNPYEKYKLLSFINFQKKKRIYNKLDGVICVSKKVENDYREVKQKVPSFVVLNGVNNDLFDTSRTEFFKSGKIRILCAAKFIKTKGQHLLVNAVANLIKQGYNIKVSFLGRGPEEDNIKLLVQNSGISDNVNFYGYLEYQEVAKFMKEYDLFIMPSYFEAIGCVYLEAMAAGMITVGVQGQGIDEVITDGVDGFLVPPNSVEPISKLIEKICLLPQEKILDISKNAQKTAERYSWINSAKQLKNAYETIIKQ